MIDWKPRAGGSVGVDHRSEDICGGIHIEQTYMCLIFLMDFTDGVPHQELIATARAMVNQGFDELERRLELQPEESAS